MKRLNKILVFVLTLVMVSPMFGGMETVVTAAPTFPTFTYTSDANSITNYTSHTKNGNNVVITAQDGYKVKVVMCNPDTVRIVLSNSSGVFEQDNSHSVVKFDWPAVSYTLEDRESDLLITTANLYVRIIKNPVRFEFYDKNGTLLNRDDTGLRKSSYVKNTDTLTNLCSKALDPNEHFYGLGERVYDSLDLRGKFIKNWNAGTEQAYYGNDQWKMPYGDIPFVLSTKGYGIYMDNSSKSVFDLGNENTSKFYFGITAGEMDYYFIAGPAFKTIIDNYTQITGRPFLPPKYMCGYQACKWAYETQAEVETVANSFRSKNIPCDVIWLDGPYRGWWKNNTNFSATFDSSYPDPQGMVNNLHNSGFKIALLENIQHMKDGDQYQVGVNNKYYVATDTNGTPWVYNEWGKPSSEVDFRKPGAAAWWGSLHEPLFKMGIDAWWIDMNDGEFGESAGGHANKYYFNTLTNKWDLTGLLEHNATALLSSQALYDYQKNYFKDNSMNKRSWVFSRGKYAGMQRYAWTWSADADWNLQNGWDVLKRQLRWESNMGLGALVYGSDLGGSGSAAGEQSYLRWAQMEMFNFFTRHHSGGNAKEPWLFPSVEAHIKKWIEWKYAMMPYIYTGAYDMSQNGSPIHRPLVYEYRNDSNVYNMEDEFMFGDWMLVAPVVNGSAANVSDTSRNVYLPEGTWIDYKDGKTVYTGSRTLTNYSADLSTVPIFVKAGAIIPMQPVMQYIGEKPVDLITLDTYPSGNSTYTMYEDDGNTYNYENGAWVKTKFDCSVASNNNVTFTVNARQNGGKSYTPDARDYMLKIHKNMGSGSTVKLNGTTLPAKTLSELNAGQIGWYQDDKNELVYVRIDDNGRANTVQITAGAPSEWTTVDHTAATFSGTWETWNDAPCYGGNIRGSKTANSYSQYTFTGTGIKWIGQRDSNFGKADVYIDGVLNTTVDCYNSANFYQQELFTATGLSKGPHTIKIVCKGEHGSGSDNFVEVDAFKVMTNTEEPEDPEDSDETSKEELAKTIAQAKAIYDDAIVGSSSGQYPKMAKNAFLIAIKISETVYNNSASTETNIATAIKALSTAAETFEASKI